MPRSTASRLLLTLASTAALAACGTTVPGTGTVAGQTTGGLTAPANGTGSMAAGGSSLSVAGGGSGVPTGGGTTAGGGSSGTLSSGAAGTSAPGTSPGAPAPGQGAPLSTQKAPGVTATTIQVGYAYSVNGAAANNAIGAAGVTQGDEKGEAQAVINDMNAHGGILGRKIVPVWHPVDALSDATIDEQFEAACADFEQDHHVFVIVLGASPIIENCAQRAGAVGVYENLSASSAQTFRKYPSYVEVSMIDLNRMVLNEALALSAQNYFTSWDTVNGKPAAVGGTGKVGIIGYDNPDYHNAIDNVLLPELARLHHPVAKSDVIYVAQPQRTSDIGSLSAAMANAVVRLRQDGVDHVLPVDVDGTLTLELLNQAESQHWRPRYGWSSQNAPELLASTGDAPSRQLVGSMGIGYLPVIDLTSQDDADNGPYSNAARRSCLKLLTKHGFSFADNNAKIVGLVVCNQFRFIKVAIEAGGRSITQASFIAGVNSLGSKFQTADGVSTFFSPAQHDGGGSYRYYAYQSSCGCMRYTSGEKPAIGEGIR